MVVAEIGETETTWAEHLADAMAHTPTSVAIITALADDGATIAMVVGSFAFVSDEPPLVSFMPSKSSKTYAQLRGVRSFAVNVLAADQEDTCRAIAQGWGDKLAGVPWTPTASGAPGITGSVMVLDCTREDIVDAGDHDIVLARVTAISERRSASPLVFFQRGYGGFTPSAFLAPIDRELAEAVTRIQPACAALSALADDIGVDAAIFAGIRGHAAAIAVTSRTDGEGTVLGSRYPIMAPLGDLFVAWQDDATTDAWLERLRHLPEEGPDILRARLADARERGWTVTLRSDVRDGELVDLLRAYGTDSVVPSVHRALEGALRRALQSYRSVALDEREIPLGNMVAPIRDADRHVVMAVRVSGFTASYSGDAVETIAMRLVRAAAEIERALVA